MDINSLYPSTYLKAADVKEQPRIATMVSIAPEEIAAGETKAVLRFSEVERGLVLNKTNAMLIAAFYGPETNAWIGQRIELYSEPVPFQGKIVDSIRVRRPVEAVQPVAAQSTEQPVAAQSVPAPQPVAAVAANPATASAQPAPIQPVAGQQEPTAEIQAMNQQLNW